MIPVFLSRINVAVVVRPISRVMNNIIPEFLRAVVGSEKLRPAIVHAYIIYFFGFLDSLFAKVDLGKRIQTNVELSL
jgi:hypothetical protein